jgi:ABC-2 type transport system ATP-binding protein
VQTKVIQNPSDPAASAPSVQDTVIHTVGLTKTFGHVNALQGIDLTVPRNSIVGFLGPNGSGKTTAINKTTAIKLLLGLSRPTAGKATLFGMDSIQDSLTIRSRVGYLAQDPASTLT